MSVCVVQGLTTGASPVQRHSAAVFVAKTADSSQHDASVSLVKRTGISNMTAIDGDNLTMQTAGTI